ncbi:MAG TPA: SLC13 family permease, partial [Bacteroidetes bacterium]|nr:SLC13 family permease [Bacteroidota bacterium]
LSEVKKGIRFNILLIAGMALALGKAMIKTGTADMIAHYLLNDLGSMGILGVMFGLYIITNIFAGYLTNIAALSIVYPIALGMAFSLGIEPKALILIVAFASAANFFTPIGYQTNLMVFGPGSYTFTDFFKVGAL